jgi:hypothetical protein
MRSRWRSRAHTFRAVKWTELTNAEDFSFSRCRVRFQGREYKGWVYYPHPETKKDHFQDASTVEVLAPFIEGTRYGDALELLLNAQEVKVMGGRPHAPASVFAQHPVRTRLSRI